MTGLDLRETSAAVEVPLRRECRRDNTIPDLIGAKGEKKWDVIMKATHLISWQHENLVNPAWCNPAKRGLDLTGNS